MSLEFNLVLIGDMCPLLSYELSLCRIGGGGDSALDAMVVTFLLCVPFGDFVCPVWIYLVREACLRSMSKRETAHRPTEEGVSYRSTEKCRMYVL